MNKAWKGTESVRKKLLYVSYFIILTLPLTKIRYIFHEEKLEFEKLENVFSLLSLRVVIAVV